MTFGSGIVSGIDTKSLISQIMVVEAAPIRRLQGRKSDLSSSISDVGRVSSKLTALTGMIADFKDPAELLAFTTTSSNEDVATAIATGAATEAQYDLRVDQLAVAERMLSSAFVPVAGVLPEVTEGSLDIDVYGESTVTVAITAGMTLSEVAASINSSDALVQATVIDTGTESYLTLTSEKTGHEIGGMVVYDLVITEIYTGATGQALGLSTNQAATNAEFLLNGLAIERTTNTVTDVLDSVTLELESTSVDTIAIEIEADADEIVTKISEMVSAYNALHTEVDRSDGIRSSTRIAMSEVKTAMTAAVSGAGAFESIGMIGVTTNSDTGQLQLDEDELRSAIAQSPTDVWELFGTDTTGLSDLLEGVEEKFTDSFDGILPLASEALQRQIDLLEDQIERRTDSLERYRERLQRQFANLEVLLVDLQRSEAAIMGAPGLPS